MFHANLKTLKSLAARKKARGLKLEALIKENPCNDMKQIKTKQNKAVGDPHRETRMD
jgi:hypothetical protein